MDYAWTMIEPIAPVYPQNVLGYRVLGYKQKPLLLLGITSEVGGHRHVLLHFWLNRGLRLVFNKI